MTFDAAVINVFSDEEKRELQNPEIAGQEYRICGRHTLKIPFDYLIILEEFGLEESERVKKQVDAMSADDGELAEIFERIIGLLPQLKRVSRQQAEDVRSHLKRKLIELESSADNPFKRQKAEQIYTTVKDTIEASVNAFDGKASSRDQVKIRKSKRQAARAAVPDNMDQGEGL